MTSLVSPKQHSPEHSRDWYPYYAGFTERFADSVLSGPLADSSHVLDPWSGSGTTTASCARQGVASTGVDVNPVLTIIAKARVTPRSMRESLSPLAESISETARHLCTDVDDRDLLMTWLHARSVRRVRAVQNAILLTLAPNPVRPRPDNFHMAADELPLLVCFFYTALFATVRDLLARFRSTNPTWLKDPESGRHRIAPSWSLLLEEFQARVRYFGDRLVLPDDLPGGPRRSLYTGSATALPFPSETFDGVLTSPPYATRIDYVRGVMPELAVLGADAAAISVLRKQTTGSPVVRGVGAPSGPLCSPYGQVLLDRIGSHSSKGSPAYYSPWMSNYLLALQAGLSEAARATKTHAPICVVVQDTHYKEVHVDLQRIVIEMLAAHSRTLDRRYDFPVRGLRSRMNPRARVHLPTRANVESLLVFH